MDKYDIKVIFRADYTSFKISQTSTIDKLIKFIEISYEELKGVNYSLLFQSTNLKLMSPQVQLSNIFLHTTMNNTISNQANPPSNYSPAIELIVQLDLNESKILTIDCIYDGKPFSFKISDELTFQKFKFNILTFYPILEQENYQIIYQSNDITNYYSNDKVLKEIFTNINSSNNATKTPFNTNLNETIKITLMIQPKIIIEYHKRCSFCHIKKGVYICRKCALANCDDCSGKDLHNTSRDLNYIKISVFSQFEQNCLENLLNQLSKSKNENDKLNSDHFIQLTKDKLGLIEKKYEEMYLLLKSIKDTQINNLSNLIDVIINKYHPEKLSKIIAELYEIIMKYKLNPFYDCEEAMRKIIEFESLVKKFYEDFCAYLLLLTDFNEKYQLCALVNKRIYEMLNTSLTETRLIFKETIEVNNYNIIMKIYDSTSVLVYDNNIEEFKLMNFHDDNGKFKEHFSNFIQLNYEGEKMFIVTGTPCQQFFCYDYQINEMQFINTLKYSHNWWPSLIAIDNPQQGIDIFCLTGSYSTKCEMLIFKASLEEESVQQKQQQQQQQQQHQQLIGSDYIEGQEPPKDVFNQYDSLEKPIDVNPPKEEFIKGNNSIIKSNIMEWKEIQSTSVCHGQGASFILNKTFLYLLFGYDYNLSPITLIERLDITNISSIIQSGTQSPSWETLNFKNPDNISSFLYYNSLMKINDDNILVLGGLKEINEIDVVYRYNQQENALLKLEKKIEFHEVKFCNEKMFFELTKAGLNNYNNQGNHEYALIDGKNNVHIIKEKDLIHSMISYNPFY